MDGQHRLGVAQDCTQWVRGHKVSWCAQGGTEQQGVGGRIWGARDGMGSSGWIGLDRLVPGG